MAQHQQDVVLMIGHHHVASADRHLDGQGLFADSGQELYQCDRLAQRDCIGNQQPTLFQPATDEKKRLPHFIRDRSPEPPGTVLYQAAGARQAFGLGYREQRFGSVARVLIHRLISLAQMAAGDRIGRSIPIPHVFHTWACDLFILTFPRQFVTASGHRQLQITQGLRTIPNLAAIFSFPLTLQLPSVQLMVLTVWFHEA
jgi:hypothetical protein